MKSQQADTPATGPDRSSDDLERLIAGAYQELGVEEGALLPLLQAVQDELGYVPASAVPHVARILNLSRAEVHGVVSFYHDFTATADPRPRVQLCRAEACQSRGVEALGPAAQAAAGDRVRLDTVYCLGLCSAGPAARVGDDVHARLDEAGLVALIEGAR